MTDTPTLDLHPDVDPTYVPLRNDPIRKRFSGIARHGFTEFDVPFMSPIDGNLWVGGCEDGLILPREIVHVVSLYRWESYEYHRDIRSVLTVTMYDAEGDVNGEEVNRIAAWVEQCMLDGPTLLHCFPTGTVVGGLTPVDITQADRVISHDGAVHNVTYHHLDPYQGDLLTFSTTGVLDFSCTPEHPIYTVKPYYFPKGFKAKPGMASLENVSTVLDHYKHQPEWTEAKDVQVGDYLVCPRPVFDSPPQEVTWPAANGNKPRLPVGPLVPSEDVAWMLGFYAADGGTQGVNSISFCCSTTDDVGRLVRVWESMGISPKVSEHDNYTRVTIHSRTVSAAMREWFGKSDNKKLPEFLFTHGWPLGSVIEGYADGDGYTNPRGAITCHTISPILAEQVRMILVSLGESPTLSDAPRHSGYANAKPGINIQWNPLATQHQTAWWRGMYLIPVREITSSTYTGEVHNVAVAEAESYTVNGVAVHNCQAGLNRSNLVAAKALMNANSLTAREAIDLLREKRSPAVLCNPSFEDWLLSHDD